VRGRRDDRAAVLATCLALTLRAWHLERVSRVAAVSTDAPAPQARFGSQAGAEAAT